MSTIIGSYSCVAECVQAGALAPRLQDLSERVKAERAPDLAPIGRISERPNCGYRRVTKAPARGLEALA